MTIVYVALALVAGALTTLQVAINGQLRVALNSPYYATLASVIVSTVCIALYCLLFRVPLPDPAGLSQHPWWVWTGGVVGVVFVYLCLFLAGKISAAILVATMICAQLITALTLDHFALLGFSQHSVSAGRIAGVVLLMGGLYLIYKY